MILLGVLFACASFTGYYLFTAPAVISPAAGIGLAGLFLLGIRAWPAIFIGTYVAYTLVGAPYLFVTCFALGHTLQAIVGTYLLQQLKYDGCLARVRDAFAIILVSLAAGVIAPAFGYAGLYVSGTLTAPILAGTGDVFAWSHWWAGMILSLIVLAPLLIRWSYTPHTRSIFELFETVAAFVPLIAILILIFWQDVGAIRGISLVYFLLLPLGWIAFRIGPRMTTLSLFLTAAIALSGIFLGLSESTEPLGVSLFQMEIFLIIISIIFLVLVSIEEERKEATNSLARNVEDLNEALDRLNSQDQAKSNFLAVLAHELRNPLATIVSSLEILRVQQHVAPDGIATIDIIERRIENMQRLLEDLLDISRIAENKIKLKRRTLDIREALTTSLENVEHVAKSKGQTVTSNLPKKPLYVHADRTRLEQVFTNLLTNATKFSGEGGHITLSVTRSNHAVTVSVKDDGIGIEPSQLRRIFDPFYQGTKRTSELRSGLGIGLLCCERPRRHA